MFIMVLAQSEHSLSCYYSVVLPKIECIVSFLPFQETPFPLNAVEHLLCARHYKG